MKKIRSIIRSAFHHPFLLFTIFSLLMIYKYLPCLFNLLLASSPTILFTTILLAIVLTYSEPNIPEHQNAANQSNGTRALLVRVRDPDPLGDSESSKSDDTASGSEIIPTFDEIHPLLASDLAHSGLESKDVSESEPDLNSDTASLGEETEKEDEIEKARKVVAWTADDQKNAMSVGSSEIERNTRLEHVIARRKAVRKLLERDLIDLEGMDSSHIQPVIAPRMNPFDLPYEEEVPGSAPSVLLPTVHNPFDITFDQQEENGHNLVHDNTSIPTFANYSNTNAGASTSTNSITGSMNQDFRRNTLYRRHESFTLGAPVVYMEEMRPEPRVSRFKPFFIPEESDGSESDTERETNGRSDVRDESSADRESSIVHESSSSDKSVRDPREIEEDEELNVNGSSMTEESSQVEGDDERTVGSTSSSSAVESDHEIAANIEHLDEQHTVGALTEEPVYDSSPSAHEKLDDSLFEVQTFSSRPPRGLLCALNGGCESFQKDNILVAGSLNRDSTVLSPNEEAEQHAREFSAEPKRNSEEEIWVAPSMASVEEMESRSREVRLIRERDIIGIHLSKIHGDLSHPVVPMLPNKPRK